MKRLRTAQKDIFDIPSDNSVDTHETKKRRSALTLKDVNITHRSKRKAKPTAKDVPIAPKAPPVTVRAPAKDIPPKSKIPVNVKRSTDIRSYFQPRTPLLDQMQECMSEEKEDYWQQARQKKIQQRPGTPMARHPSAEPDYPCLEHAGTTPRYPKVIPEARAALQSKMLPFGAGSAYLPDVIPEYEWSDESDLSVDFTLCLGTSTPIRGFQTSIDEPPTPSL